MSLDQLRYFVAVAEEESVTRAARRLGVSQPPLSRQLKSLEDELGTALFARTPKGVRLLPPGAVLLERVRGILAQVDELSSLARGSDGPGPVDSAETTGTPAAR